MNRILKFLLKVTLWFLAVPLMAVVIFKWVPVPATPLMAIRSFEQWQEGNPIIWKHEWVSIDDISNNLELAVVCTEDQNFLKHHGFDIKAIEKAIEHNKTAKRMRGASTISQQTAKNVFLWPGRGWVRKGLETYVTFLIELIWSKERIMEVYLNSIEMGNGIYGAEAASHHWFKKEAMQLSKHQAAALAVILPNPRKYKANPASIYIERRKAWTVRQMGFRGGQLDYDKHYD